MYFFQQTLSVGCATIQWIGKKLKMFANTSLCMLKYYWFQQVNTPVCEPVVILFKGDLCRLTLLNWSIRFPQDRMSEAPTKGKTICCISHDTNSFVYEEWQESPRIVIFKHNLVPWAGDLRQRESKAKG